MDKSPDSLAAYLSSKGFTVKRESGGDRCYTLKSPWKPDERTPSAVIYASGVLKCYSTGKSGNILTFTKMFGDKSVEVKDWTAPPRKEKKPLPGYIPAYYTNLSGEELDRVHAYAASRRIYSGYYAGVWTMKDKTRWPSLIFPHYDEQFTIIGAKFRLVDGVNGNRMRAAGRIGFYILDARTPLPPTTYLIESETSANSLWEYCKQEKKSAVIISCGSVGTVPRNLPFSYPLKKIIDFDGSEQRWAERIAKYRHLGGEDIKLRLEKGQDINSLWATDSLFKIDFLL